MGVIAQKRKAGNRQELVATRRLQTTLTGAEVVERVARWSSTSIDRDREQRVRRSEAGGKLKKWASNPDLATGYRLSSLHEFIQERSDASERLARITAQKAGDIPIAPNTSRFIIEHTGLTVFSRWYAVLDVVGGDGAPNVWVEIRMFVWVVAADGDIKGRELYLALLEAMSALGRPA